MRTVLAALLACSSLFAATPEKTAKIEKLFDILKVNRLSDEIAAQLVLQVDRIGQQIAQQAGLPVEERAKATEEVRNKMTAAMKDLTSWERLKPSMIQIYDDTYSEADLDGVLAFFTGPSGQKYLDNSVTIVTRSRDMAGTHVKEAGDAVQALAKEWLDQHKPAAAPAPAPPK
jgi:hypothetical protein